MVKNDEIKMKYNWEREYQLEKVARDTFYNKIKKDTFTEADVISSIDLIKIMVKDDESAHCMEKALWQRVLQELAKNNPIAQVALETNNIEFSRWYA